MEWEDRSRRTKKKRIRNIKTEEVRMTTQEDKDMKLKKKLHQIPHTNTFSVLLL